jgi:AraC-like DNA-binding protein
MDKSGDLCSYLDMLQSVQHTIHQRVSEIFDLYTELHDIRISIFNPAGQLIYPDAVGRPNCKHCTMLRETLELDSKCRDLDQKMMRTAYERNGMITYTCHAGMREATAPIIIEDRLVGYVMLGQFRSEAAPERSMYSDQWESEQGNSDLQRAYLETPVFPEHKIETLLKMFRHLLEFIISGHLIHLRDYDLIQPIVEHIEQHPDRALSLEEAAAMAGRSPSTVSRIFKKVTGRSFKQYRQNYRLELAASLLAASPTRPVSEIAGLVGYEDALYFSRIFRKFFGVSPSVYRQNGG